MWTHTLLYSALLYLLSFVCPVLTANPSACNNAAALCGRPYDKMTHLGAHDSPFIRDASTDFSTSGNQFYNSTVQLSAGVRLLTAQVFPVNGNNGTEWHLCHTSCDLFDAGSLSDWLASIKTWMDANPNDVVTVLLVNANASASDLNGQFQAANMVSYAFTPQSSSTAPTTWPTLDDLISNNTRLLTFIASFPSGSNDGIGYLMQEFNFIVENNFEVTSASNFSCSPERPSSVSGNAQKVLNMRLMPFMNHFLDSTSTFGIEVPNATYAPTTNGPSGGIGNLGDAANQCMTLYGSPPTFILVDFFNVGPAMSTVDKLNGVTSTVGRTSVSTAVPSPNSSSVMSKRQSLLALILPIAVAVMW